MKKLFFFVSICFTLFTFAADFNPALDSARALAADGIIVDQSSIASQYRINTSLETQEASMYRLNDTLSRQEALKIALSLRGVDIPPGYYCRGYFADISEDWVCRVVEFAADYSIVTRANSRFRPHDSLTLAESLKILMVALQIPLSNTDAQIISGNLPAWQKHIVITLRERNISFSLYDNYGRIVARMSGGESLSMSVGIPLSYKMTRGTFFQLVTALRDKQGSSLCYNYRYSTCPSSCQSVCTSSSSGVGGIGTADCEGPNSCIPRDDTDPLAHCTVYNDGCNDCTLGDEGSICTKRACFWKGIPSCSACEVGYSLRDNRCIKTSNICIGEGKNVGNYSLPPEYQNIGTCCSGLTNVSHKDGLPGASNICANIGDGYCDSRFESTLNSSDCRTGSSCIKEGGYAGGGYVMYPENLADFQCCSGLTRAERKDGSTLADAGYTCINQGDMVCDARYESEYNSSDCRLVLGGFDSSVCQDYYDGCNTCSNTSGSAACTMRYCFTNGPAYCTTYKNYIPVTQTQDGNFLGKVFSEIQNYTKDISCTSSSQCQWKLFGNSPCGGSSIGVKYSSKNIDQTLLNSKATYYTDAQRLYNQTYPVFGTCMVMTSPAPLSCVSGQCTSPY